MSKGEYYPLAWDGDGSPSAHYVTGHVTAEVFRATCAARQIVVPDDAKIEHVYVRSVRVGNDEFGNRLTEIRHAARGRPMTYWEIAPNRATGS
jgi:hypothetical protein